MKRALAAAAGLLLATHAHLAFATDAARGGTTASIPFSLGARAGPQSIFLEGDGAQSDLRGYVAGVDAALRLSRYLSIAGAVEGSLFDGRSDRVEPGPAATSLGAFSELCIDTNPDGPWSARIDVGPGYRWLWLPMASGPTEVYGGLEPLRLRAGPAYRVGDVQVTVALGVGFGLFLSRPGDRNCAVSGTCQDSLIDSDTASPVHFVGDLTVAVRGWP
jgi:hypothetical protein